MVSDCEIAGVDLVFVLDSSSSIGSTNFFKIIEFVSKVVNALKIGPTRSQVGIVVYSTNVSIPFNLNTYSNKTSLLSAIDDISYIGGGTDTAQALRVLVSHGFSGARPPAEGVPQVAMVITDGVSNDRQQTIQEATLLHQTSITTYAVGIGGANISELNEIASTKNGEKLVRFINSFNAEELLTLQEDLRKQACTGETELMCTMHTLHEDDDSYIQDTRICIVLLSLNNH